MIRANQVQNLWGTVDAVSNTNIADLLDAPDTIDGVTLATGDRVLLVGQTDKTENGIYIFAAGTPDQLIRPFHDENLLVGKENTLGAACFCAGGTAYAKTTWVLSATNGGEGGYENKVAIIGTDEMEFSRTDVKAKELDADTADLVGLVNETNTTYTLASAYASGTVLRATLNGVVLDEGVDWSIAAGVITMTRAPQTGDKLTVVVLY